MVELHLCVSVCVLLPHPDSVGLSQPYRIGQLDLDLSTVEGAKHTHHLQQTIIQPAGRDRKQRCCSLFSCHGNLEHPMTKI